MNFKYFLSVLRLIKEISYVFKDTYFSKHYVLFLHAPEECIWINTAYKKSVYFFWFVWNKDEDALEDL